MLMWLSRSLKVNLYSSRMAYTAGAYPGFHTAWSDNPVLFPPPPKKKQKTKIELLALCKPRLPFAPLKNTKWKKFTLFSEGQTRAVIRLDTKHKYQWQIYIWRRGDDVIELIVSKPFEISRRYWSLHSDLYLREFTSGIFHLPAQVLGTITCFHDDLELTSAAHLQKQAVGPSFPLSYLFFHPFFFILFSLFA